MTLSLHTLAVSTSAPGPAASTHNEEFEHSLDQEGAGLIPPPPADNESNASTAEPVLPPDSSSDNELPLPELPHTLLQPTVTAQVPDMPHPATRLFALHHPMRMPDLLLPLSPALLLDAPCCSTCSTAGVLPDPALTATQYLQGGCPAPSCIKTYSKSCSCLQSAPPLSAPTSHTTTPAAPNLAPEPAPLPSIKEEEDTATPGPSQLKDESINKFNFLTPHTACSTQHWIGKRTLLAQGIGGVYRNDSGPVDNYLTLPDAFEHAFVASAEPNKPKTFQEAMQHPDANLWYQAAVKEMEVHIENGTWEIVKLPPGCKAIGCCWAFKIKRNTNGTIEHYKAHVVTKGYA